MNNTPSGGNNPGCTLKNNTNETKPFFSDLPVSLVNRDSHDGHGLLFPGQSQESGQSRPAAQRPAARLVSVSAVEADLPSLASLLRLPGWRPRWLLFSASPSCRLPTGWCGHVASRGQRVRSRVRLAHGFIPRGAVTRRWCLSPRRLRLLLLHVVLVLASRIIFSTAVEFQ